MSPESMEFVAILVIGPDNERIARSLRDLAPRLGLAPLSEDFNKAAWDDALALRDLPAAACLIAVPVPAMTGRPVADDAIGWDEEVANA